MATPVSAASLDAARERFAQCLASPQPRHSYPVPAPSKRGAPTDLHAVGGQASLYVHIPYCTARCTYCFFVTQIGQGAIDMGHYVDEVLAELELMRGELGGYRFTSMYYGGGTPGLLPADTFKRLHEQFAPLLAPGATVTVETHPHAADAGRIAAWRSAGVDRVSVGVQTTDPALLEIINRAPTGAHILPAIERLVAAGFEDVNADLLFGLPNQTMESWSETLESLVATGIPSLSIYRTSYIPDTLATFKKLGASFPTRADVHAMYALAFERLNAGGFEQPRYGCSTFSRRSYAFGLNTHRYHILSNLPMVGLGMGAYGSVGGYVYMNHRTREAYQRSLADKQVPVLAATPVPEAERPYKYAVETWKLGFLSQAAYTDRFGEAVEDRFGPELAALLELGELEFVESEYRMTRRGSEHPDVIADMFVSEAARHYALGGRA